MKLDLRATATLLWVPAGREPSLDAVHLDAPANEASREIDIKSFRELGAALVAATGSPSDPKLPWIRVGDALLSPAQVARAYAQYRSFEEVDV